MRNHYLVSLVRNPSASAADVDEVLNQFDDWYRFRKDNWIVVTEKSAKCISEAVEQFAKPQGNVLVCRLDLARRSGWMPKNFWSWLRASREASSE